MLLDQLHLKLQMGAHPHYYDTAGAMLPGVANRMGVPMSVVREAARDIIRLGETRALLTEAASVKLETHEVILVVGLVLAGDWRMTFEEKLEATRHYLPFLTNWATCDTFAQAFRDFEQNRAAGRAFIESLLVNESPWYVRTGLVLMLHHYIDRNELDWVLEGFSNQNVRAHARRYYYVSMALAWAASIFFIRFPDEIATWLRESAETQSVDIVTIRRAVQKVRDSYRVSDDAKKSLTLAIKTIAASLPPCTVYASKPKDGLDVPSGAVETPAGSR